MTAAAVHIEKYLADLEERIDSDIEDAMLADWQSFWDHGAAGDYFKPVARTVCQENLEWPEVHINDTLGDYELMALSQLAAGCSGQLKGGNALMSVRSNYGTGILPTVFGAELFVMPRENFCLPTSKPMGGADAARKILDSGKPDIYRGQGGQVLEMAKCFRDIFKPFPKIEKYIYHYHPDLQGPMDVCELIWGSDIFVDLFDEPELVCDLLNSITEAYLDFMRAWREAAGWEEPLPGYSVHWGFLQKGQIMIRDDSAMNLSPEMFAEFIMPYDNRLLNELGGGMIHSCGRVDHWTKFLKDMPGLYGFNMSQPEYNDMEVVYRDTVDRMIPLVTLPENVARDAINSGRDLKGRVACW